jgi:hypothetical protein
MGMSTWIGQFRREHPRAATCIVAVLVLGLVAAGIAKLRSDYLGPGPGVADRIAAAHAPIVVSVEYRDPNPFQGALGQVWIALVGDATRDQVNAFWCNVVVPSGGAEMYRAQDLYLWPAPGTAHEVVRFEPVQTCPPVADSRPWVSPTPVPTPGPTPAPFIYGRCSDTYGNFLGDCDFEREAVLTAIKALGYSPLYVEIDPGGFRCHVPFPAQRLDPTTCPLREGHVVSYVRFVGTDKVAALSLRKVNRDYIATIEAFEVPPDWLDRSIFRPQPLPTSQASRSAAAP